MTLSQTQKSFGSFFGNLCMSTNLSHSGFSKVNSFGIKMFPIKIYKHAFTNQFHTYNCFHPGSLWKFKKTGQQMQKNEKNLENCGLALNIKIYKHAFTNQFHTYYCFHPGSLWKFKKWPENAKKWKRTSEYWGLVLNVCKDISKHLVDYLNLDLTVLEKVFTRFYLWCNPQGANFHWSKDSTFEQ